MTPDEQRDGAARIDAVATLFSHADSVELEHGPGTGALDDAAQALETLGVSVREIDAALRKLARP